MPFEILNRAFVFLCRSFAIKRAEIFPFARSWIFLWGIQPILAGLHFPNHGYSFARSAYANLTLVAPRIIFAARLKLAR
jgi:hypothetical protein